MKETTNHKLRYPETKDSDTLAAYYKNLAEDTERELDAIAPKQITGVTKKQLLIANASGVVTAVTASGDVTNDESGAFSIGASTVLEAMLSDGAVTSRKSKLTAGFIQASGALSLAASYADIPGGLLEVTPAVASTLLVVATFQFSGGSTVGSMSLDGAAESTRTALGSSPPSGIQIYSFALTVGKHTLKQRARRTEEVSREVVAAGTGFAYLLVAS